jgi:hypothetical protein
MNRANKTIAAAIGIAVVVVLAATIAIYYGNRQSNGTLSVQIKDSPVSGVSHIYLTVSNITLQGEDSNSSTTFKLGSVTFDLLALVNVTKNIGNATIPDGNYTMIRFTILSATATIAGANVTLSMPSNQVKVPIHFEIASGKTTSIVLDITADQTLISASDNLRPLVTGEVTGP